MINCYLGLGSNLRYPKRQLKQAITHLQKVPRSVVLKISSLYLSRPWGVRAQPPYYNMVLLLHTTLPPQQLLHYCQQIENKLQRVRKKHWGARTLDIDLLLYGQTNVQTHNLTIPHPHLLHRDFVLVPLLEIAPEVQLPNGQYVAHYLKFCEKHLRR